jgi:hypothetical protein
VNSAGPVKADSSSVLRRKASASLPIDGLLITLLLHQVNPDCRPAQALKAKVDEKILRGTLLTGGLIALVVTLLVRTKD